MKDYKEAVKSWIDGNFDPETKCKVIELRNTDPVALEDAFYKNLEFGTGGLRGIMGVGTNRMNKYTVGMATQGLANYIKKHVDGEKSVCISFDSRNNSKLFAKISADVLSNNGIKVYLFDNLRPTPELSYSIRAKKATAGIMITASHNPKEYNGMNGESKKVYNLYDASEKLVKASDNLKNMPEEWQNFLNAIK